MSLRLEDWKGLIQEKEEGEDGNHSAQPNERPDPHGW